MIDQDGERGTWRRHADLRPVLAAINLDLVRLGDATAVAIRSALGKVIESRDKLVDRLTPGAIVAHESGPAAWARDFAMSIIDGVQVPLLVLNADLNTVSTNEAFQRTFGVVLQETQGVPFFEMGGAAWDIPRLRTALQELAAKSTRFVGLQVELGLVGRGRRTVSMSAQSLGSLPGQPMILVTVEDVTERSRAESERASLLAESQRAREEAQQATRAKGQFIDILSHELRTPLTRVLLHAQQLRRWEMDPTNLARAVAAIERGTKTQAHLIEDLLDASRIGAGGIELHSRRVDLAEVVRTAVDTVGTQEEGSSPRVDVALGTSSFWVEGDPARLQRAVRQLIANGLKFTPAPGRVTVHLGTVDAQARLRVSDTGIGIAPEFLPQVFGAFAQADSSATRPHGGLGLGLAIARHVVELHGGTLHAESAGVGQGATFTVLLPLAVAGRAASPITRSPAEPPPVRRARVDAGVRGLRVLLVDDDQDTREIVADLMGREGMTIRAAASAQEGVAAVETFLPDVILSDIAMPGEDGYSFIRRVRALGPAAGGAVPAIALSALSSDGTEQRALSAGFQLHLAKPVDMERLIRAVGNLAQRGPAATGEGELAAAFSA